MAVLRRITVLVGALGLGLQHLATPGAPVVGVAEVVTGVVFVVNELTRWRFVRTAEPRRGRVVNAQIGVDILALTALLHLGGGITSPAIVLFVPPFFIYGAVLSLGQTFAHAGLMTAELGGLATLEYFAVVPHHAGGFYPEDMYLRPHFLVLTILFVSVLVALCASMSHYLRVLVRVQEERASALASERGALLARNEREAARVRALLDVAQHVSGTHSIEEFLGAVCDTTVTLARVPRVEVFLWDADEDRLRLAAARGLAEGMVHDDDTRYSGDVPIVARLRAGEVVDFGAAPSHVMVGRRVEAPFRRGFAAPLMCHGTFQGALFVGYDDENSEEFLELVLGIARQAALALANVRTIAQQQEDAEVSNILLQVSQALSACLEEEALWQLIIRACSEVLDLPWAIACRFDEHAASFSVIGTTGVPAEVQGRLAEAKLRLEESPPLKEVLSRREMSSGDAESGREIGFLAGLEPGGWAAVPLFRGSWVAGLLLAGNGNARRPLSRRQLRLAEGLGHHASIALQNARLVADLEAADQLKSEFVSTMSHELRTPLNVIIGYTEMLREGAVGPVSPGQLELVNRLDARGRELLELIEATLHVGRLEAGRDTVEIAPIEVRDLVKALQASTAGLPRQQGVEFVWDVPTDARDRIMTDRAKLSLVVRNLVSNALKFTASGSVRVRLKLEDDGLVIEVADTGIGISAEHLPIIFDMFRQVDGSMTRRHGGVGLGLYIVKQFVGRLGGTITVTSAPGEGSTFRLVLPGAIRDDRRREFRAA